MSFMPSNPAQRRFTWRMIVAGGLCLVCAVIAKLSFRLGHVQGMLAYLMAVLPAFPIVGTLVGTGIYLSEEKDEFQRNVTVQALLGGIGAVLAATTVWGYLEDFMFVPRLDLIWIYPIFWIFVSLSIPVIRRTYR